MDRPILNVDTQGLALGFSSPGDSTVGPSSFQSEDIEFQDFPNFEVFPTELFDYNFMSPPHVDWVCHIPLACLLLNDFGFIKAMLFGNDGESLTHGLAHFSTFDYMFMPDLSGP